MRRGSARWGGETLRIEKGERRKYWTQGRKLSTDVRLTRSNSEIAQSSIKPTRSHQGKKRERPKAKRKPAGGRIPLEKKETANAKRLGRNYRRGRKYERWKLKGSAILNVRKVFRQEYIPKPRQIIKKKLIGGRGKRRGPRTWAGGTEGGKGLGN